MTPLAEACVFEAGSMPGSGGRVHKWKPAERATLRAELDAAYFHLYGLDQEAVIYILTQFQTTRTPDAGAVFDSPESPPETPPEAGGAGSAPLLSQAGRQVVEAYDALAAVSRPHR